MYSTFNRAACVSNGKRHDIIRILESSEVFTIGRVQSGGVYVLRANGFYTNLQTIYDSRKLCMRYHRTLRSDAHICTDDRNVLNYCNVFHFTENCFCITKTKIHLCYFILRPFLETLHCVLLNIPCENINEPRFFLPIQRIRSAHAIIQNQTNSVCFSRRVSQSKKITI